MNVTLVDVVDLMILRYDGPNLTVEKLEMIWARRDEEETR